MVTEKDIQILIELMGIHFSSSSLRKHEYMMHSIQIGIIQTILVLYKIQAVP